MAVTYTLYQGGGNASRTNDHFKGDQFTLHDKDYKGSGYDRGHLVPAEDFAYSDSLQEITFSYYNCVPQHPKLNRGKWKKLEARIRKLSKQDSVIVVSYLEFEKHRVQPLNVPKVCYKVIFGFSGGKKVPVFGAGFTNDAACKELEIDDRVFSIIHRFEPH